ncbi:MAG TPA: NAD(P)/FAD-dependent oxidoreductase [Candidatus Limnocylindrales bacterium]|nr:NAD(P)/FAD-dependent oxidoreductase [Candidatus Limnocylindrales bacterium]
MPVERTRSIDTVVVGAGQAGLVASWHLRQLGLEHVLLDRRTTLGGGWQDRWESFQLVSPNWTVSLPGLAYRGDKPDGFMPRDEIVAHFRAYAAAIDAPIELDTEVTRLRRLDPGRTVRFRVETNHGRIEARQVVVAAGPFQVPHIPAVAAGFAPSILQLHSHAYRHPDALPPGAVLLIGSGQTGVQLAEELMDAGRTVWMAVGRCGRAPRRYRGRDLFWWLRSLAVHGQAVGTPLPSLASLPDARLRLACNPHMTGHGVPHDTNLREMATRGLRLVGRLQDVSGTRATFTADLSEALRFADTYYPERLLPLFDRYAERIGEDLPPGEFGQFRYEPPEVTELDLHTEGIAVVLWTSGYRPAFDWLELDVFDDQGLPVTQGEFSSVPGLSFLGSPWLVDMASANLVGLARDAETLAQAWTGASRR